MIAGATVVLFKTMSLRGTETAAVFGSGGDEAIFLFIKTVCVRDPFDRFLFREIAYVFPAPCWRWSIFFRRLFFP
jgi:hypothetical protein